MNGTYFLSRYLRLFFLFFSFTLSLGLSGTSAFTPPTPQDYPESLELWGKQRTFKGLKNPYSATENNKEFLDKGAKLYFTHCFLCHGDLMDGGGVFGQSFTPKPANFTDPKSVLDRPQAYTFWRIAKGGPGLPVSHEPWNSAMPAWEKTLSEEEIWQVVTFIHESAGRFPSPPLRQSPVSKEESLSMTKNVQFVMVKKVKAMASRLNSQAQDLAT